MTWNRKAIIIPGGAVPPEYAGPRTNSRVTFQTSRRYYQSCTITTDYRHCGTAFRAEAPAKSFGFRQVVTPDLSFPRLPLYPVRCCKYIRGVRRPGCFSAPRTVTKIKSVERTGKGKPDASAQASTVDLLSHHKLPKKSKAIEYKLKMTRLPYEPAAT